MCAAKAGWVKSSPASLSSVKDRHSAASVPWRLRPPSPCPAMASFGLPVWGRSVAMGVSLR